MADNRATTLANLANDISAALHVYRSNVLASIADHMDECAKVFMDNAQLSYDDGGSPYDPKNKKTAHYRDCWAVKKMKKAKYVRYIGNTKKVKAHGKDSNPTIPLINILEFSKRQNAKGEPMARPHVANILGNSQDEIVDIIVRNIKKESK